MEKKETFGDFGRDYQDKVVQALLVDHMFAEQMADVVDPKFFELRYLQEIVRGIYDHRKKYGTYPSMEIVEVMTTREREIPEILAQEIRGFIGRARSAPLNGDGRYVQATSLDFCKKQTLKRAIIESIDRIEDSDYDSVQRLIKEALARGSTRDLGTEYSPEVKRRADKSLRRPVSTGWPVVDKILNGGWERGTLSTIIAPTGAGKSMFLSNISAATIEQGLNSLYVTCEMAEHKIELRHDAYFSGVEINSIVDRQGEVSEAITKKVRGRLFVKEYPTKTASVQTIRSLVQRLEATKGFKPDVIVVDYADLLRSSRNFEQKRFELEGVYEELRALAQEFNVVVVTADQTNRAGLNEEVVTLQSIAESYAKATVCDVIMTVSRRMEDKLANQGRLFIAKSRLGDDGIILPFLLRTATVKVTVLANAEDPIAAFMEDNKNLGAKMAERHEKLMKRKKDA